MNNTTEIKERRYEADCLVRKLGHEKIEGFVFLSWVKEDSDIDSFEFSYSSKEIKDKYGAGEYAIMSVFTLKTL